MRRRGALSLNVSERSMITLMHSVCRLAVLLPVAVDRALLAFEALLVENAQH